MKDLNIFTITATLLMVSLPGYILCKELSGPTIYEQFERFNIRQTKKLHDKEEDILEAKIKSENVRSGPAFLDSHVYRSRRTERVKSIYSSIYNIVNHNLDVGNKHFCVSTSEDDRIILNVVKRLLIDELDKDGYTATISVLPVDKDIKYKDQDQDQEFDDVKKDSFQFVITII